MIHVRPLTAADRALLALALENAGIKARIRKLRLGVRVVFKGPWQAVAEAINPEGFRHASGHPFEQTSFQGDQAFVRYMQL